MARLPVIRYYGWSSFVIEGAEGALAFDPFFRPYCGARWSELSDYADVRVVCLTHGHQEHYLDCHEVLKAYGGRFVSSPLACDHLCKRFGVGLENVVPVQCYDTVEILGFRITPFLWRHRDISPLRAVWRNGHVIDGMIWAWNALYMSPFTAPFYGFHVALPDGTTVVNYGEGLNPTFEPEAAQTLVAKFGKPDVLIAGAQCFFDAEVAAGAKQVGAPINILHHPHEKMFELIGAKSSSPSDFVSAVRAELPESKVIHVSPGWNSGASNATGTAE